MVYIADTWHIYHNDLKCANILIGLDGQIKLTDFGLARELGLNSDNMAGTPGVSTAQILVKRLLN